MENPTEKPDSMHPPSKGVVQAGIDNLETTANQDVVQQSEERTINVDAMVPVSAEKPTLKKYINKAKDIGRTALEQLPLGGSISWQPGEREDVNMSEQLTSQSQERPVGSEPTIINENIRSESKESNTPMAHEKQSQALDELEDIPIISEDAKPKEINKALEVVNRNLASIPMVYLKQVNARVRELERALRAADTEEGNPDSATEKRITSTKLSEILSETERIYPGGLGFYKHHVTEKAKLKRLIQDT